MKLLSLISGGLDSAISSYLMLKKGHDVEFVHFDINPYGDKRIIDKTKKLVQHLSKLFKKKLRLHILPHGETLTKIIEGAKRNLTCVLCKRAMLAKAEELAKQHKCNALLTGDSLASVASQTLDNLYVVSQAVDLPVIRPLICFNKQETIDIAKKIGTYEISIQKAKPCSAVPSQPATRAELAEVETEEAKANLSSQAL